MTTNCDVCGKAKGELTGRNHEGHTVMVCKACLKKGWKKAYEGMKRAAAFQRQGERLSAPAADAEVDAAVQDAVGAANTAGLTGDEAAWDNVVELPVKKAREPKAGGKKTVASRARELIAEGKTNKEIFAVIQPEFGLPDDKRWYPGWYRAQAARKGKE